MKDIVVKNINDVMNMNLAIPNYQRPYCWSKKSVRDLLNDIQDTYKKNEQNKEYKYRIGTIILYYNKSSNKIYEIVDGQQRIITLSLIKYVINNDSNSYLLDKFKFSDKKTINNIKENYLLINNWYTTLPNKKRIKRIFNNNLEFLVVIVNEIDEAFQLFDSQNSSGKELYPHDLLKAFHLREMEGIKNSVINRQVEKWEGYDSKYIANLFEYYLFPIRCWSSKTGSHKFCSKDIDEFKGITKSIIKNNQNYNYHKIYVRGFFQINQPFYSGKDFFDMIDHYLKKLDEIIDYLKSENYDMYLLITSYLYKNKYKSENYNDSALKETINNKTIGMRYVCQLFLAALLFYYDRFGELNSIVINKIFTWASMLRIDLEMINMKSINIYALGYENSNTNNHIPIFNLIANYINHYEIYDLSIIKMDNINNNTWKELYTFIEKLDENEEE